MVNIEFLLNAIYLEQDGLLSDALVAEFDGFDFSAFPTIKEFSLSTTSQVVSLRSPTIRCRSVTSASFGEGQSILKLFVTSLSCRGQPQGSRLGVSI